MRKVTYARVHQDLYVPNAGSLGNVFPPQSKTLDGLSMSSEPNSGNLVIKFAYRGIANEILIPSANVVLMLLAPEEVSQPKGKVSSNS